jgi:hypothetical protein
VTVKPDPDAEANAYYEPATGEIHIDTKIAADPSVAPQAYAVYALHIEPGARDLDSRQYGVLNEALAYYFSASFLDDPKWGKVMAATLRMPQPYMRNLDNQLSFLEVANGTKDDVLALSDIWGGLFWDLRKRLGREQADPLLVRAWQALGRETRSNRIFETFLREILAARHSLGPEAAEKVVTAMRERRFIPYPAAEISRQRQKCRPADDPSMMGLFC